MCLRHVLGMAVCLVGLPRLERCAAVGTPLTLLAVLDDRQIAAKPSLIPAHQPADQVTALGRAVRRRDIPTLKEAKAAEREAAGAAAEVSKEGECSRRWCWGRGMVNVTGRGWMGLAAALLAVPLLPAPLHCSVR